LIRLYSISFLILFLLNISGYYAVLLIAEQQLTKQVTAKIEQNVDDIAGDLILKMPMKLPYPPGSNDYERISGETEYDGEIYHFVKQRFYQDTLYVVCVKDYKAKEIREAIGDCVKTFTDQPAKASSGLKIISSLVKDFLPVFCHIQPQHNGWNSSSENFKLYKDLYAFTHHPAIFHPPQAS